MQEFSADASDLLEKSRSVLKGIPMERNLLKDSLFAESRDAEMDTLTIIAVELILNNLLIKTERYYDQYLEHGEHENASDQGKEDTRNCHLTIGLVNL